MLRRQKILNMDKKTETYHPFSSYRPINQRGAFWVHMCPDVGTQWTNPLITEDEYLSVRQ